MNTAVPDDKQGAERILAAAQQAFAEKGFDAASMQDIAQRAGVSKSNVFHHFKSKEELYFAVIGCACGAAREQVFNLLEGEVPFAIRLQRMMTADVEFMLDQPERSNLVLREITNTRPDDASQPAPALLQRNATELVEMVRAAQKAGEIRADADPAAIAFLVLAANKFYFQTRNLLRHFPEVDFAVDHHRFVGKISDLMLNGLSPKPGNRP